MSEEENNNHNQTAKTVTRAVAGSVLGASIGYLISRENRDKIVEKVKSIDTDGLAEKGSNFTASTKDSLKSTATRVRTSTGKAFDSFRNNDEESHCKPIVIK
ncbi:YtxH domain-containing protein [Halalkalibacillus halophilus]|uniref:YtxH domain-containing protein n=1 Tax=Halalkalibacillus halophilus TaxID=392827 RepID=UPI00040264B6|nr:YtxH domain-containing protein [Halalkalibacillus halophilus]